MVPGLTLPKHNRSIGGTKKFLGSKTPFCFSHENLEQIRITVGDFRKSRKWQKLQSAANQPNQFIPGKKTDIHDNRRGCSQGDSGEGSCDSNGFQN